MQVDEIHKVSKKDTALKGKKTLHDCFEEAKKHPDIFEMERYFKDRNSIDEKRLHEMEVHIRSCSHCKEQLGYYEYYSKRPFNDNFFTDF